MRFSILGCLVLPQTVFDANIVVDHGKIVEINKGFFPSTKNVFDYRGSFILPGLIEVHGHFREPGMTHKEDILHGTAAALAGGFTTVIDMPNTNPPTITQELLYEKIKLYSSRSYTDYAFFLGVAKDSLQEIDNINPKTILGIKVFMAGHETTPTTIPDDETLGKILNIAHKLNLLVAIHAEDQRLINLYTIKYKNKTDPSVWSKARPKEVVIEAVKRAIRLAKKYHVKIYLLHLSTHEEFDLVKQAKRNGLTVYGELVSYQLLFNTNDYKQYGNLIKVAPALRSPKEQDKLWKLFRKKIPDVICSEHTPHELETKNQPNVWLAQSGMPNIQESLPAVLTKWVKRFGRKTLKECLQTIVLLNAKSPAKIFGIDSKGEIAVGKDADFVIIDPKKKWKVRKQNLFSKCAWSVYEGMDLIGRPQATFLRGKLVYENGKILVKPGFGKMIAHAQ